jgi:23S rRNA pseudouridine1911/1915/1917 synthase
MHTKDYEEIVEGPSDRLDRWLHNNLDGYSITRVKKIILDGRVLVNGRKAKKSFQVKEGDIVSVKGVPKGPIPIADSSIPLEVLYDEDDIKVVNKPAGVSTHPLSPEEPDTLINAVVARWPSLRGVGKSVLEPGLIHRLDKGTSGLIILAGNDMAFDFMRHDMKMNRVKKKYLALVKGEFRTENGEIQVPIARHKKKQGEMVPAIKDNRFRGKAMEALTRYQVKDFKDGVSLVELDLITGVMHQLRVHMAHINHPVLGDALYGTAPDPDSPSHALQAYRLKFVLPDGKRKADVRVKKPIQLKDASKWI